MTGDVLKTGSHAKSPLPELPGRASAGPLLPLQGSAVALSLESPESKIYNQLYLVVLNQPEWSSTGMKTFMGDD